MSASTLVSARPVIDADAPHVVAAAVAHLESRGLHPMVSKAARQRLWWARGQYARLACRLNEHEARW